MSGKFVSVRFALALVALLVVSVFAQNQSGNYTRPLPTLNCVGGSSAIVTVSAPSIPSGATITRVTLTGTRNPATSTVTWVVTHVASGRVVRIPYNANGASTLDFNPLTPDTQWRVQITCTVNPTTVTNGQLRVEYRY
jgi:hypothetical protein